MRLPGFFLDQAFTFLLGNLSVYFTDIILTWNCEISSLHNSAIDVLSPVFSHLFLVNNSKKLGDEFRIDSEELNQAIPDAEDLVCNNLYITCDESSNALWFAHACLKSSLKRKNSSCRR